mgnify:CR=1 FL=1
MEEKMNKRKISRFLLERYILNELDEKQKYDIEKQLETDFNLQKKVKQILVFCIINSLANRLL